ncbi:RNA polymerase sigma factor SigJ [Nannocystis sp. SCPEA4]|uniref:RNA polymerase sigma factor SigJ n=1 Tax=Nannocystis sp. SCPEA4 TaxID=2996787 RepID=UPI00226EF709|nr:RNA polymerase sigma factor SigJ [Nannocystis sp. SCPEA4]MCY1059544.1 RNA polymerase sigma factor SigJ [Nannocystis sp. SCPEA4]
MDPRTRLFESHRPILEGLAYRMLGTRADALDVVQETFLKWNQVDIDQVRDPRAWLVTVCTRIGLNTLQSARSRRELYVGTWLPEPLVAAGGPEDDLQIDETVSVALMLALERLTPPERAAFLLHDVFGHDFDEIAGILGKQSAACRKLASRARARVRDARPKFTASTAEHRRLMSAFVDAARGGRADELRGLLAESVELYADGGGKADAVAVVLHGPDAVVTFLVRVWRRLLVNTQSHRVVPTWFNGSPGVLIVEDGALATALAVSIEGGVIRRIYGHRNPDKLAVFAE